MASNSRSLSQSRPPPPMSRPPPPFSTVPPGPPPSSAPPLAPVVNPNTRKFSLQNVAPQGPSLASTQQPLPPTGQLLPQQLGPGLNNSQNTPFKRPPEKMEENKIYKFGESKVRSPSPARGAAAFNRPMASNSIERKISAPATMTTTPPAYNTMNGNSSDMQCFMNLLEREETDFVDQVKKSKAFIQSVIRQEIFH